MAEIGWIDFSRNDRNRVGSILDMLRPEGQVDELGIGTIRDALSDRLFPGISTIQTRAKYFFIVPYILRDFLRLKPAERKKKTPSRYLEQEEYEIMWQLAEKYEYQEGNGVIGISKRRPNKIVRRPSEVYWNGLNVFGSLNSKGLSANAFLNSTNKTNQESLTMDDEDNKDDADADFVNFFNVNVPINLKWKEDLDLNLNKEEAGFLRDAMVDKSNSLLSLLVSDDFYELFEQSNSFTDFVRAIIQQEIPSSLKEDLVLAHDFAIVIEGAHLAYNQELQKQFYQQDYFLENWQNWYDELKINMLNYDGFDPEKLFHYATSTKGPTADFIRAWWNLMQSEKLDLEKVSYLIRRQEAFSKGKKARLKFKSGSDVKEGKRIGLQMLQYRFGNAKVIVRDVMKGMEDA
ncbi:MAG: hypothetical protein ACJA01_003938 [Saprospiraceae bacterium]|jgi:hypothetical protein